MADDVKIDLQDNSPYRVALDLAKMIASAEGKDRDRKYWLELYAQCRKVVLRGANAKDVFDPRAEN